MNHYVWDIAYIDAPVMRYHDADANGDFTDPGDDTRYYTYDANWNVTGAIDEDGTVLTRYGYDPYGMATEYDLNWANGTAPTEDGHLYAGYFFDAETGLYHVRNRQYQADTGKFLQRDPIGYSAGDSNLTRYVGSSPLSATDPMGLEANLLDALRQITRFGGIARDRVRSLINDLQSLKSDEAYLIDMRSAVTSFSVKAVTAGGTLKFDVNTMLADGVKNFLTDQLEDWSHGKLKKKLPSAGSELSRALKFLGGYEKLSQIHVDFVEVRMDFKLEWTYLTCDNGTFAIKSVTKDHKNYPVANMGAGFAYWKFSIPGELDAFVTSVEKMFKRGKRKMNVDLMPMRSGITIILKAEDAITDRTKVIDKRLLPMRWDYRVLGTSGTIHK